MEVPIQERFRKSKLIILAALVVSTVSISCGKSGHPQPAQTAAVTNVKTETVKAEMTDDFYEATGTIRSRTTTMVSARMAGNILGVHAREGDRVRPGQLLAEIDNREAKSQLERARAAQREAEGALEEADKGIRAAEAAKASAEAVQRLSATTLQRYQNLLERRSVSQQEFDEVRMKNEVAVAENERAARMLDSVRARRDQVRARIDQAKAEVASAQIAAGYSAVSSPVAGVITERRAEPGAFAAPGSPLFTIEDDSRYRLEAQVEESMVSRLSKGGRVTAIIDAIGSNELAGVIDEIVPSADPSSRTFTIKIALPPLGAEASRALKSGVFGRARFPLEPKERITVPKSAIVERGQITGVFVAGPDNTVRLRLVTAGKPFGNRVEILSGLKPGEKVVTEGAERLSDGARVQ